MPRQERDAALFVRFESKSVLNKAKSWGEEIMGIVGDKNVVVDKIVGADRAVHENIDYILIQIPGDKDCVPHRPATFCAGRERLNDREAWDAPCRAPTDQNGKPRLSECDVHRFLDEWKRYKAGSAQQTEGASLKDLPGMDPATLDDLAYFKVVTIEQLAGLNDSNVGAFFDLRQRARDWLAASKKADTAATVRAELEAEKQAAKAREAAMQKQIDELLAGQAKAAQAAKEKR